MPRDRCWGRGRLQAARTLLAWENPKGRSEEEEPRSLPTDQSKQTNMNISQKILDTLCVFRSDVRELKVTCGAGELPAPHGSDTACSDDELGMGGAGLAPALKFRRLLSSCTCLYSDCNKK